MQFGIKRLFDLCSKICKVDDYAMLFRAVVDDSVDVLDAEGGTFYIYNPDLNTLEAVVVQNRILGIEHEISEFDPREFRGLFSIDLKTRDKSIKQGSIAGECWRRGEAVVIKDLNKEHSLDLEGIRRFDKEYSYTTSSIIAVPLLDREGEALGVVQVVNSGTRLGKAEDVEMVIVMALLLGMAVENRLLLLGSEKLFEAVVEMISAAIDERSKTTGGHCHRVTELTMMIAEAMASDSSGHYEDFKPTPAELNELRVAALLHDVGKIATSDFVLNKSRKLEKVVDRLEVVRLRFGLRQQSLRIQQLEKALQDAGIDPPAAESEPGTDSDLEFLEHINSGGEGLAPDDSERIEAIAARDCGAGELIEPHDLAELQIRRGTLNPGERKAMEAHAAISISLLERLPWPRNLAHVAEIAAKHHENCDGTGYPNGIGIEGMSLRSRILGLADRFEGLSAIDRSYRKGKSFEEVMQIMTSMAESNKIDPVLFKFFCSSGVHIEYKKQFLDQHYAAIEARKASAA